MTALDDRMRQVALDLIETFGKVVTYTPTTRARNESTGETPETPGTPVALKVSPPEKFSRKLVDGNAIKKDDLQISLAAKDLAFTPVLNDLVTIDTVVYSVTDVNPVFSGEQEAIWTLQLRRR